MVINSKEYLSNAMADSKDKFLLIKRLSSNIIHQTNFPT